MGKSISEIAKIAATWWADKLTNPKFDNGDEGFSGFLASALAQRLVKDVEEEVREKFIEVLSKKLEEKIERVKVWGGDVYLGVDYGPDTILSEAAEEAGINSNNFPWKTSMWIDCNSVSVSYGYGASIQKVYANKEYWRQKIEKSKESIERYKSGEENTYIEDLIEREKDTKKWIERHIKCIEEYEKELEKAED